MADTDRDDDLSVDELDQASGGAALADNTNCSGGCVSNTNCPRPQPEPVYVKPDPVYIA